MTLDHQLYLLDTPLTVFSTCYSILIEDNINGAVGTPARDQALFNLKINYFVV